MMFPSAEIMRHFLAFSFLADSSISSSMELTFTESKSMAPEKPVDRDRHVLTLGHWKVVRARHKVPELKRCGRRSKTCQMHQEKRPSPLEFWQPTRNPAPKLLKPSVAKDEKRAPLFQTFVEVLWEGDGRSYTALQVVGNHMPLSFLPLRLDHIWAHFKHAPRCRKSRLEVDIQ